MQSFDDVTDPTRRPSTPVGPGGTIGGARHGRDVRRQFRLRGVVGIVAAAVAVVLVSGTSITAFAAYQVGSGLRSNAVDVGGSGGTDGAFNVLAIAGDNAPGQSSAAYGVRGATLNDSNILLHVSADHTSATAVSLPRDLVVDQPACTEHGTGTVSPAVTNTPLNQAYGRGGLPCVVSTVEQLTGMSIPYAALMSFGGIIGLSDAIGGVPVCVTEAVDDPYTGLKLAPGTHTVSGSTALAFLRDRHGVGDGSDLSRISSLQQFLSSLVRKVKGNGTLADPGKLYKLADVASRTVTLSTSLAHVDTMVAMARVFQGIGLGSITFVQYPGTTDDPRYPGKVVPDPTSAARLVDALKTDRPFTLSGDATGIGSTDAAGAGASGTSAGATSASRTGTSAGASGKRAGSTGATAAPSASEAPEVLGGVTGQTANQKTCAVAAAG